jgi:hypothetical protein
MSLQKRDTARLVVKNYLITIDFSERMSFIKLEEAEAIVRQCDCMR